MKKVLIGIALVIIVGACAFFGFRSKESENKMGEPQSSQMKAICELATMDCYYHNVAKYEEKDAVGVLLWKKDKRFWVDYSGIVTVGIDASKLQVDVKGNEVTITIPQAYVMSTKVDQESLTDDSFYVDVDSAAIDGADQSAAFKEAQEKMTEKASQDTRLLENARQRAQLLLEDYVNNIGSAVGKEYEISWVFLDEV